MPIPIPPELLQETPLIVFLLVAVVVVLWKRGETSAKTMLDQAVLNERSLHRISLLEYQRDEAVKDNTRCEGERDRCRDELDKWRFKTPEAAS